MLIILGIHFCGVHLHAVDDELNRHSFALDCKPYTLANQTSANIRKFVDDLLGDYNLFLNVGTFVVTDNEPKMIAAFKDVNRVGCSDHYINKILEHGFTLSQSGCDEVIQLFDDVKGLVVHFRRSHRQVKLSRKLQTFSSTRFNGAFYMMVNIHNSILLFISIVYIFRMSFTLYTMN